MSNGNGNGNGRRWVNVIYAVVISLIGFTIGHIYSELNRISTLQAINMERIAKLETMIGVISSQHQRIEENQQLMLKHLETK